MEHFYQNTEGENWFSFAALYKRIVEYFPTNSWFVEVGSWKGRSSVCMAVEIINSGKNIRFDCIDPWDVWLYKNLDPSIGSFASILNAPASTPEDWKSIFALLGEWNDAYGVFMKNINPVKNYINPIKATSENASTLYPNDSVDFVFIDGGHDYDCVKNDIKCWIPKIKKGGIMAGHDYPMFGGVQQAVDEFFGNKIVASEFCWICNDISSFKS